jgi:poly(ADP-ribose) glycohydrolase ARH3
LRARLAQAAALSSPEELPCLGNGITVLDSVPTAMACFASAPDSFGTVIARAIFLGGDTDTIAAMAGALSGAYLGAAAIPAPLLQRLEDEEGQKGRSYIAALAEQLYHSQQTSLGL